MTAPATGMSTILIVDDTPANLGVVVESLESRGYRVVVAQDGGEALQRAGFVKPDLVLLDVMMPGIDGLEVCRRLKNNEDTADIPVIFMTALAETEHKIAGFKVGCVDFVTKPVQIDEVIARVGTHLSLRAMQRQLEAQNLQLQRHRQELEYKVTQRTAQLSASNRLLREEIDERKRARERLALVDFALNQVNEAVYLIDKNFRFRYVNDEACRGLGYRRETLLGMGIADIDPDCPEAKCVDVWQRIEQCGSLVLETRHLTRDGRIFPVEVNASYFEYDGAGYNLALVRDITERRRQQARDETRRRIFEQLANGGDLSEILGLVVNYVEQADPDCLGSIMLLNAEGTHLFSAAAPSLPDDYTAAVDGIAVGDGVGSCGTAVWRGETVIAEDIRSHPYWAPYKHLALKAGLLSCWSEPIFDSSGKVLGTFGIYRRQPVGPSRADLELLRRASYFAAIAIERKRVEERLCASEREYRTLAENSPDMIVRYDRDCRRIYVNPAYERQTGIPLETAWLKTPAEICKPLLSGEEYMARLKAVMASGQADRILLEWQGEDGGLVSHDMHAVAEYDDTGQVAGVLVMGHNITELKITERRLEDSRARLRTLTAKREEAREEERKRIAREIHDELGQLLNVLRLNVSTLDFRFGDSNPDLRDKTHKMVATVDRAILMVRNLATRLRPAVLSLGIVPALEWLVREYADSTGIVCRLTASADEIPLDEDRAMLVFRIVQESLTNILRHSGADRADIALRYEAGICEVDVCDNGKGFDPEQAGRRDSYGIVGMRERALILGGTLDIAAAVAGGTLLKLRIPMTERHESDLAPPLG